MPSRKLPIVSGEQLIKTLRKLGYEVVRQRGSHIRLKKMTEGGVHSITVPNHLEIAKGTLNDILTRVSERNQISKEHLIKNRRPQRCISQLVAFMFMKVLLSKRRI
jgi:predicted RNA binding protein YcfA (HicA-like mRNA interferase family)